NWVDAHVTAAIGDAAIVTAKDIDIEAVNHTFKDFLDTPNIRGKSGGAIAGGGADSHSSIALTTLVDIGDNARLSLVGNAGSPGAFILKSLNDIFAKDSVAFTAGGALAGLSANSTTATITFNTITIDEGALLETAGEARLQAEKEGFADLTGSAKATSWVSAVQDWLNGAAAAAMNDATIFQEGHGIVDMNGTVR